MKLTNWSKGIYCLTLADGRELLLKEERINVNSVVLIISSQNTDLDVLKVLDNGNCRNQLKIDVTYEDEG